MTTASNVQCTKCVKNTGIATCDGCLAKLCRRCFNDHRQELSEELDNVVYQHDILKQELETPNKNDSHQLLKQIDEWKKDSIDKINQLAEQCRTDVVKLLNKNKDGLIERFRKISNRVRKGRDDEDYVERDLSKWMADLKELKDELIRPSNFRIEEDKQQSPWIQKISVHQDIDNSSSLVEQIKSIAKQIQIPSQPKEKFDPVKGNATVQENGSVAVNSAQQNYSEIRELNLYTPGVHRIKIKIEKMLNNYWIFFGIVSSYQSMGGMPFGLKSSYGWAGNGKQMILNGASVDGGTTGYDGDIKENDIVELIINCDQSKIQLCNERSGKQYEIDIDKNICKFPWQLHLNFLQPNDRVRILP
ncbi:unnamed protein product [Didymodactylos carnosus]|uniref:B30.2/SPRY domain-containing protein n=1 Tax=Didymodactylos carnosus TaxID=1234261 RepID=A0A815BCS7_9BILA|nr:unnamed protein product [Didymodactylos carnosus]CAF4054871.1 unnamed protein product [Didymodactylos carnosus]